MWVITCYENHTVHRRACLSLDSVVSFLWKREFLWRDHWLVNDDDEMPLEFWPLFESITLPQLQERVMHSSFEGEADLGTWGPWINGRDTGFTVAVHLTLNKLYP